MKVRLTLDVDDRERYIIAKYYQDTRGFKPRTRATRAEVGHFARGALRTVVGDYERNLRSRQRTTAARLADGASGPGSGSDPLPDLGERQMLLF